MAAGWLGCGRGGEGSCLLPPFGALSLVWPLSFTQFQGCEGIWHHMVLWGRNGKLNKPPNKLRCPIRSTNVCFVLWPCVPSVLHSRCLSWLRADTTTGPLARSLPAPGCQAVLQKVGGRLVMLSAKKSLLEESPGPTGKGRAASHQLSTCVPCGHGVVGTQRLGAVVPVSSQEGPGAAPAPRAFYPALQDVVQGAASSGGNLGTSPCIRFPRGSHLEAQRLGLVG